MKLFIKILIVFIIFFNSNILSAASWCKVVYTQEISDGELKNQLSKCKTSDNLFLAIHAGFLNAGHLLNSMVAENCDLRRNIISTKPRKGDPFFTAVCEYRAHSLR